MLLEYVTHCMAENDLNNIVSFDINKFLVPK
jgi:hypothetical protein